jgi:hypothetical protein
MEKSIELLNLPDCKFLSQGIFQMVEESMAQPSEIEIGEEEEV